MPGHFPSKIHISKSKYCLICATEYIIMEADDMDTGDKVENQFQMLHHVWGARELVWPLLCVSVIQSLSIIIRDAYFRSS